jgi:hypothetical protein
VGFLLKKASAEQLSTLAFGTLGSGVSLLLHHHLLHINPLALPDLQQHRAFRQVAQIQGLIRMPLKSRELTV